MFGEDTVQYSFVICYVLSPKIGQVAFALDFLELRKKYQSSPKNGAFEFSPAYKFLTTLQTNLLDADIIVIYSVMHVICDDIRMDSLYNEKLNQFILNVEVLWLLLHC